MSGEAVRRTVSDKLNVVFTPLFPTVKLVFENLPSVQPTGAPWIYVDIIDNFTSKAHIGTPSSRYKSYGVVSCSIYVPEDTGTKTLRQIADGLASVLADKQFPLIGETGSITFFGFSSRASRPVAGWYMKDVDFQFRAFSANP